MKRPSERESPRKASPSANSSAKLPRLKFLTSAVDLQGCPEDSRPEIAIIGRSNAGKSSLINALGNSRIAQVSSSPGKTRLLNFYEGPAYRLVDMPGYGFAARSGDEQRGWQGMIEPFLAARANLIGLLLVMDVRRDWSEDEENLLRWLAPRDLPVVVVLTKADKLSRSAGLQRIRAIQKQFGVGKILATSALKKQGFAELDAFLIKNWVRPGRSERSEKGAQ